MTEVRTQPETDAPLSEQEYSARFIAHMIDEALRQWGIKEFPDDITVEEYAREVVSSHWGEYLRDPSNEDVGPEESAEADVSYWGDE
jgi:hypothetical protein